MSDLRNKIAHKIGSPKIFVYVVIWLIFLVLIGTIAQKDYGLYLVQQDYFYSWFKWFGFIPTPSVKFSVLVLFINLSCYFFRKGIWRINKLGITVTHMGLILLLFGSGLTYIFSVEGNMLINENERSNYFENYYVKEFAVINTSNVEYDDYVIFDELFLQRNNILSHNSFPFSIKILDYYINCQPVRRLYEGEENFKGMAKNFYLQELDPLKEFEQNRPGLIYEILESNESNNGIYMIFMGQPVEQNLNVNDDNYQFKLRPVRTYLPFEIELVDFEKVMHPGTDVAKSYSSEVNLIEDGISRRILIEMNQPMRHYDYTFYQASFIEEGDKQTTVLATVKNYGRMFPYISSIIMCIGILVHLLVMALSNRRRKNV